MKYNPEHNTPEKNHFLKPRDIDIVENIDYRSFIEHYALPGKPVILRGAMKHLPASQWTPASFKNRFGKKKFNFQDQDMLLEEIIDNTLASTPENPAPYFNHIDIETEFPELIPDLAAGVKYCWPNYRFLPFLFPHWYFPIPGNYTEFFMGGTGRAFPILHCDFPPINTFIGVFHGEKEWIAFEPSQAPNLYLKKGDFVHSEVDNIFEPDFEKYPDLKKANPVRIIQQAGDIIFIPCQWIHTARNLSLTMSVHWDQLSHSSWDSFVSDKYARTLKDNPTKAKLVNCYLRLLGYVLGSIEKLAGKFGSRFIKGRIL